MVAALDTIKTRKSGELKSQLNVYQNTKTQEIQKIKGSVFAQGMQNVKFNPNDSIFNHPALTNQSQNVQQAQVQKTNADSTSISLTDTVTKLINNVVQKFESVIDNIKNSIAELSAITSPQTTGQAVNPKENMPTDNQGTENKPAQPKDSNRPNVGFGEETVTDKSKTDESQEPEKTERKNDVQQAQTSSEIDQATMKKIDEQYNQSYQMGTNGIDSIFKRAEDLMASQA